MSKRYTITAGDNSTDLGIVGRADTLLGAKRIGRAAVRDSLPHGEGEYKVRAQDGQQALREERSSRTGWAWVQLG